MAKKAKAAKAEATDETETAAAAKTGTGTGTGTKTATKEKVAVTVHAKLAEMLRKADAAAEKAGSLLVEVAELVEKENISNAQLIKTIMDVRGIAENSAKSQASRIRSIMKDPDTLAALKAGDVTVRAALKSAQARRVPSALNKQKAFDMSLAKFCESAKALGQPKTTILATVEAKLDEMKVK